MPVVTISLPPDLAAKVKAAVANGRYASDSDVIRKALQQWSRDNHFEIDNPVVLRPRREISDSDVAKLYAAFRANRLDDDTR